MENTALSSAHLTKLGETLIRDLSDADLASPSTPNGKTAGWLLGHLCITGDFIRRKCGRTPLTPKEWGPKFTLGTKPSTAAADYPQMAELQKAFSEVYGDLIRVAPTLSPEMLSQPSPFEQARDRFPTLGAFLSWIMTGHLGYHLGQLSEWKAGRAK